MCSVGRLVARRCHTLGSLAQAAIDVQYYAGADSGSLFPHAPGLATSCVRPSPCSTAQPGMPPAHRFGRPGSVRGVWQTAPCMCRLVETSRPIAFVILRTAVALPVASHLTSR